MLLQKEKQSIEEIGKKDKKIYERRKVSLSNIYDLLFPQKSRKYFRTNVNALNRLLLISTVAS